MVSPLTRTRSALPATAHGTSVHAYTLEDWGILALIALIWGSSFLFMEIGLRSFAPGVVTLARIGLGTVTLALLARARTPVDREDWGRIALLGDRLDGHPPARSSPSPSNGSTPAWPG